MALKKNNLDTMDTMDTYVQFHFLYKEMKWSIGIHGIQGIHAHTVQIRAV